MAAFPEIEKIRFEGPDSTNPLAFRHYDADAVIEGRTMKEHLRFSVVYWHTFRGAGADPFGPGCAERPWKLEDGTVEDAINRAKMAFEFIEKLGAPYVLGGSRGLSESLEHRHETRVGSSGSVSAHGG